MGPEPLAQVLQPIKDIFKSQDFPELLIGLDVSDDAAVYKINDKTAIIHTLDFFTPVVDDPYDYGAIAAANSLSDVYAMGGEVRLALNICGFPPDLPQEIIIEILRGGAEKVAEAGAVLAGGHTINDKEPKYGLSVIGFVHPNEIITKSGAKPGDILILTKPLGVGVIATALKNDAVNPKHLEAAVKSMKKLNRKAAEILHQANAHACTDITGFSIIGHSNEIAEKSNVQICLNLKKLPFIEGAKEYAKKQLFPCGSRNNEEYYKHHVNFAPGIRKEIQMLLFTPETSGGLLVAVAPENLVTLLKKFDEEGENYWIVGVVKEGKGIVVTT